MALKPEYGIVSGLAVAAVVFAIHEQATPTQADILALPSGNQDIDSAERKATWMSAGIVAGISLIARDPTIFIIGSAADIGLAWWTRHSNNTESSQPIGMVTNSVSLGGSANSPTAGADTMPPATATVTPAPAVGATTPVSEFSR